MNAEHLKISIGDGIQVNSNNFIGKKGLTGEGVITITPKRFKLLRQQMLPFGFQIPSETQVFVHTGFSNDNQLMVNKNHNEITLFRTPEKNLDIPDETLPFSLLDQSKIHVELNRHKIISDLISLLVVGIIAASFPEEEVINQLQRRDLVL